MNFKLVAVVALINFITSAECALRKDQDYWLNLAQAELDQALELKWNTNTAKNVIMFIGDGMGPNTVTATRIYKGGEGHKLAFEKFPHVGLLKTYSANQMVPDSAATATALLCGAKTNSEVIGVDASVSSGDCAGSLRPNSRLSCLASEAMEAGKSAGLVTTMRVTHATPAPLYAHCPDRRWECEANVPADSLSQCKDIARQLVEDWPGRDLQVILGGGMQMFISNSSGSEADPIDNWSCRSQDGRNLIQDYITDKTERKLKYSYVTNNRELESVNYEDTDYLLGIFANSHLKYEFERDSGPDGTPSIAEMTQAAIKVLSKNKNGFFLMVEGGNIDMAHHRGRAKTAINETSAFAEAIELAVTMVNEKDTLILVTADHTHTLSINGYQDRGTDVFGLAEPSKHDGRNYTTLSYATGGPGSMHYYASTNAQGVTQVVRRDPSLEDTKHFYYEQVAGITLDENSHGGGDVVVYARGPFAHLFHNIHEQHYVYHAVSYAAKLGLYHDRNASASNEKTYVVFLSLISTIWAIK